MTKSKSHLLGSVSVPPQRPVAESSTDNKPATYKPKVQAAPGRQRSRQARPESNVVGRHGDRASGESGDTDAPARTYLTGPMVCRRYAISQMGLWRWMRDADLGFPQPTLRIRDRRYWLLHDLVQWEERQRPQGGEEAAMRARFKIDAA